MIRIFAGFDPREAGGFAVFAHSVFSRTQIVTSITPIGTLPWWQRQDGKPGSTDFSFTRFLVPFICQYDGWVIYADGADMLCQTDIADLWDLRDSRYAVQVVKHAPYKPSTTKMWGTENKSYPRKNWSSLMLFNCEHPAIAKLTPQYVATAPAADLHQFKWLDDNSIGTLPARWNVLVGYQDEPEDNAGILHFTDGLPPIAQYPHAEMKVDAWYDEHSQATYIKPRLQAVTHHIVGLRE